MMRLAEAVAALGGRASGGDALFTGVSTDSRSLRAGDLFVALRGERFDGHEFLKAAAAAKAAATMVDSHYHGEYPVPALVVEDTKRSLGDLARYWRARFQPALVAICGSNGKTTVKEMLAAILRAHAGPAAEAVLATRGNLNNDIGLPLTLLGLRHAHRWCAIELGMKRWMERNGYATVRQMRGSMTAANYADAQSFERANYLQALQGFSPPLRHQ